MYNYELNLSLSDELKKELVDFCDQNASSHKFIDWMHTFVIRKSNPLISKIISHLPIKPISASVLISQPNAIVPPHLDIKQASMETITRKVCVSWALSPDLENFAPTLYYNDKDEVIYSHKYTDKPFLMQPAVYRHGMINNNHKRYLLQMNYSSNPEKIIQAFENEYGAERYYI